MRRTDSLSIQAMLVLSVLFVFSLMAAAQEAQKVPARVTQPVDNANRVILKGNVHPLALPKYDQGPAPDSLPMERMLLVLQRSADQEAALGKLLAEQQSKSSSNFHRWLTPEQFGQQFGPADSDVQAVTGWLSSEGFVVNSVAAGRTVIEFSGTAGQVRQSFNTEIHKFTVKGEDHWANASDPQIPAALAPVVAGISSLNNFPRNPMVRRLGMFSRSKLTGQVKPLYTITVTCPAGVTGPCYYLGVGPSDFATIYNVAPLWSAGTDGTGQTIAIVGESDINTQDVADFRTMFGLPTTGTYLNVIYNGPNPGIIVSGDEGESDLDVEWAGAVAKGATIDLVVSQSTEASAGIDLSALYIIDNNLAPVMSESYGACEEALGSTGNAFYNSLFEQGAAQGITVLLAAGDSGSAGCDSASTEIVAKYGINVSGLASTPFDVAVGGTDFNVTSSNWTTYWSTTNSTIATNTSATESALSYIPELTWNDSCAQVGADPSCLTATSSSSDLDIAAGSGGPSIVYSKPSWQTGTGVPSDGVRDIPDVSLFSGDGAHGSFYIMCEMDLNPSGDTSSCDLSSFEMTFQGVGGTSASAQVFAGIMALVNQQNGRQGNANYVLYPLAATTGARCSSSAPTSGCIFYDVTAGNNSVACLPGTTDCYFPGGASGYGYVASSGSTAAYYAGTGYDLATGWGSVNAANLVNNWASVAGTFTTTTTALSGLPTTTIALGTTVSGTVSVLPAAATGDVALIAEPTSGEVSLGASTLTSSSGGSVLASTNLLPGGTYNVVARYAGNGTYGASTSTPVSVTVVKGPSKTNVVMETFNSSGQVISYNATSAVYGSPYLLRADVTNSGGTLCYNASTGAINYLCPTGTLTVIDNGNIPTDQGAPSNSIPGTLTLNSAGYAEDQFIQMTAGTNVVLVTYTGDNSYLLSNTGTVTFNITQATTSTVLVPTLTSSAVPLTKQGPFNPPRWLVPGGAALLFALFLFLIPVRQRQLQTACGMVTLALLAATMVACGGGGSSGGGGGSSSNYTYSLTATVSSASFGAAPTGSVTFYNGSTSLGSVKVTGTNGSSSAYASATATLGSTFSSSANVTAAYSGDTNYAGSTSSAVAVQ